METKTSRRLGVLLFPDFELLDVYGPVEMFGNLPGMVEVTMVAAAPGPVRSAQGPSGHADVGLADCPHLDLLLVPGGIGTRAAIDDEPLLAWVRERVAAAEIAMTVCTGTLLLARAGLLDGRRATTNKMFFDVMTSLAPAVEWVRKARWVDDGNIVTSSGVSAGMDMALAVVERLYGPDVARALEVGTEYDRHRDAGWDPFAEIHAPKE